MSKLIFNTIIPVIFYLLIWAVVGNIEMKELCNSGTFIRAGGLKTVLIVLFCGPVIWTQAIIAIVRIIKFRSTKS